MAQYTKVVNGDSVRYKKDGGKFVKADDVPQNVKDALDQNPQGTIVDELADVVDPTTETDEGSGDDESVPTATPPVEDDTTTEDESTEDDESDEDEADDEEETQEEAPAPKSRNNSRTKTEIGGMGFPAKNGKTLSIFSNVPHETVKNVGGIMVPLTLVELNGDRANGVEPKTDTEIIEKLKKLGKI